MNWVKPLHLLVIFIIINVVTSSVDDINEELRDEMQSARRLAENAVNSYSAAWRPYQYTTKKQAKIDRIVDNIKAKPNQLKAVVSSVSPIHNYSSNAIFSSAMDSTYLAREAINFIGTVRKTGYNGDIVVAVLPESENTLIKQLLDYKVIVYTVPIKCSGKINSIFCSTKLSSNLIPATMVKYYLFQYWATLYSDASQVLVSDFRDVIFQSNPFKYKTNEWLPSYNLQVFQEHHPNRVINRCGFNKAWIFNCYGFDALKMIGSNTISSAGVTLGTSRGIAVYVSTTPPYRTNIAYRNDYGHPNC